MLSTMQEYPLTINALFEHGAKVFADSVAVTFDGTATRARLSRKSPTGHASCRLRCSGLA